MNVSELYKLALWVQSEIVTTQIPQKYQNLQQLLQRNAQPNQHKQPFEKERKELIETIRNVPLEQLTKDQVEILEKLGILQAIGDEGARAIEDILYRNALDIASAAQKLNEIYQRLTQGIQKITQIMAGLQDIYQEESHDIENNVLVRVYFKGSAKLSNVNDFKKWGEVWHEIGRGIAMVHNAAPEDVRIVGATSGSIVIELGTPINLAATLATIVYVALDIANRYIETRKKIEELRLLKINNEKLLHELEQEASANKEKGIESIINKVIEELKLQRKKEGDKILALKKAIERLVGFMESGGELDFHVPEEDAQEDNEGQDKSIEYKKLRQLAADIRIIERKIHALSPPKDAEVNE